jgi:hypothetical protein
MNKITLLLLAIIFMMILSVGNTQARPSKRLDLGTQQCRVLSYGILDYDSESWGIGGQKFREVCKSCHSRDNDKGAPFLHAESYVSDGWNRIFYKRRVQCAKDGSWDILSQEELLLVNDYLYRNADWTYDPNDADSCG